MTISLYWSGFFQAGVDGKTGLTDVLDYLLNWATWLGGDTISASTWEADDGITVDRDSKTTTTATVWLSGGSLGRRYTVSNTIVTDGGRTRKQSLHFNMQAR